MAEILEVAVPTVSQHLSKLKASGLVTYRRDAQTLYYRLTDHPFIPYLLERLLDPVTRQS
jgi:DNA-binding transcriptional ArsR family regulator